MTKPSAPAGDDRLRTHLTWVALAYALFIAYGSLVPLNFEARPIAGAWQDLWRWPAWQALRSERLDTAVNVLLTVPLAFGLAVLWVRQSAVMARALARLGIVLAVLPLSLGVEWAQMFLPGRTGAMGDVLAQSLGSCLGVALQAAVGSRTSAYLDRWSTAFDAQSRAMHLLQAYVLLLLLFNMMPLDLTLSPVELYRKWREGRVVLVPFGFRWQGMAQFIYDTAIDIALWIPVGMLWRMDARAWPLQWIALRAALVAAALEGLQLLVLSRITDVTDVVLATLGAVIGAGLVLPGLHALARDPRRMNLWSRAGLALWVPGILMVYGWPFDLRWPPDLASAFVDAFTRVPFLTYFQRNEFGALNEILRKLLAFAPAGLLLRLQAGSNPPRGHRPSRVGLWGLAIVAFVLEAGQLLLADRVADITDACLAVMGALIGWRLAGLLGSAGRSGSSAMAPDVSPRKAPVRTHKQRPADAAAAPGVAAVVRHQLLQLVGLALLLWLLARLPGVPYNVAKLMPAGAVGLLSAAGLAVAAWWGAALPPAWLLTAPRKSLALLPLWLILHGVLSYAALRSTVPVAMLHKVIGSPVLGWPGPWEDLLHYLPLHTVLLLALSGGHLLAQTLWRPDRLAGLLAWLLLSAVLAWPLHWAVVDQAVTDNLVELMRGGGGFGASALLAWALVALCACASASAAAWALPARRVKMLLLAFAAAAAAAPLLLAGLEPLLIKYDKSFSALQFLLSANREAYASGPELAVRYAVAFAALTTVLALLQAPWWRLADGARPAPPVRRGATVTA